MTLAHEIYEYAENKVAAIQMTRLIVSSCRKVCADLRDTISRIVETIDANYSARSSRARLAHNIAIRLMDVEKNFSRDLGKCWMEHVDEYSQIAMNYGLNPQEKLEYLHDFLSKDVKRF